MKAKIARSCGFLIFRREPNLSFLLMQHPDRWDLPKGHVDEGETDRECALRELVEETNISEDDIHIDDKFVFTNRYEVNLKRYGDKPVEKTLLIFLAELTNEVEILPTEHSGFRWVQWSPPHDIQKKTIDGLLAQLEQHWQQYPVV
jgi:8-oxo-dGTP pyrophosphatase MutT (NUDIX family)